jgi:hypothetical protein
LTESVMSEAGGDARAVKSDNDLIDRWKAGWKLDRSKKWRYSCDKRRIVCIICKLRHDHSEVRTRYSTQARYAAKTD